MNVREFFNGFEDYMNRHIEEIGNFEQEDEIRDEFDVYISNACENMCRSGCITCVECPQYIGAPDTAECLIGMEPAE